MTGDGRQSLGRPAGPLLLGVRHHGPGSARAVRAALEAARPAVVLIEGPPEADALLPLAADPDMSPPVALLAHAVDGPGRSVFWPLAEFSSEWVALRWALEHGVPARFIDLPAAHTLAWETDEEDRPAGRGEAGDRGGRGDRAAVKNEKNEKNVREKGDRNERKEKNAGSDADAEECEGGRGRETGEDATGPGGDSGGEARGSSGSGLDGETAPGDQVRIDPLGELARAAGYDDAERWWEDVVEHRSGREGDPFAPFTALEEAMTALRETHGSGGHDRDLLREAHMRLSIRAARREAGDDVAVVCGAWHVPALRRRTTVAADRALLKGLPRTRVDLTWIPWTHRRLSRSSGYGAGIDSPGWYGHLFAAQDRPVERWMTKVAGLLRAEDRIVSTAHVIEAARLAGALAAMRGRPLAGLSETTDAVRAVLCDGSDIPLTLVHDRLVVGDVLGAVPPAAPAVPLQRDLTRTQRRLRLKPEAAARELELDLRKDTDADRSRMLHRLRLLGVGWGDPAASRGSTGTFRETWRLRWEPELSVRVAEAGMWGTTVLAAASAKAEADAVAARGLAEVTGLAEQCLLAGLPDALPTVTRVLTDRAALDTDVGHLAQALPALVRALRYGDVRGTDTAALAGVAAGLAERVFVGLPPACTSLDADAAEEMRDHLEAVQSALGLLGEEPAPDHGDLRRRWQAVLRTLSGRDSVPGLLRGRAVRLLLDGGALESGEAARLMGLVLSPGTPPADAAGWIEGFLGGGSGGGMLLVHDERLRSLVDIWLTGVPAEAFTDVLPLLRRTFSAYEPGVRRTLGELARRGPGAPARAATAGAGPGVPGRAPGLDRGRADAVLPVVRLLLGSRDPGGEADGRRHGGGGRHGHGTEGEGEGNGRGAGSEDPRAEPAGVTP
ncbi:DUF5682 family protein [Streptomyces sp. NPDC029526]|uniref:DUF5682 family protein n=1 Tax=Streptomyces sp. NPDC029526 TaxID=3155728 RepID=UPI0033E79B13